MDKQARERCRDEHREEMMELSMAVSGLEAIVERYLEKEDFAFLSALLAVTEELKERQKALINRDASLVYHKNNSKIL